MNLDNGYVLYVKLQSAEQWWSDDYKDNKYGIKLKGKVRSQSTRCGGGGGGGGGVGRGEIPLDIPHARGRYRGAFGLDTTMMEALLKYVSYVSRFM
jgi:hypothetical protein